MIKDSYNMPEFFPEKQGINQYLSGYTDGEGCFCVSLNKSKRHKIGWEIRPSFSVSQNRDRASVLELFKTYFRCGTIRPDRSDCTLKYEVRAIDELVENILPHFEKYPLLSDKQHEFERFAEVCRMVKCRKHLTKDGFQKILSIAKSINRSGNKKYLREKIKI
jgi:hypothetical protein